MTFSWRAAAVAALLIGVGPLFGAAAAQDDPANPAVQEQAADDAPKKDAPADKQQEAADPADPAAAPEPEQPALPQLSPEEAAQAKQDYEQKLTEWKNLLKQLRELQVKYQLADDAEAADLKTQWEGLVARGNQMLPELTDAARRAYLAAPGEDRELVRFLAKLADDAWNQQRYDEAFELSQALLAGGIEDPMLYRIAGSAAFAIHQFDIADDYLEKAQQAGALDDVSRPFAASVDQYKTLWEEEQKIREAEADANLPRVKLATTKGDIVIELFENEAPNTVANFISLVEKEFYDGLTFHRVLPHFMAQGGDPNGDGSGGPGYEIPDEHNQEDARMHFRGSLSMAKTRAPDTGGSQFFLTFVPTAHLNGLHTVFGRVIEGFEVLDQLQRRNPEEPTAAEPDKIVTAEVLRKRDHEYTPKKVGE